MRRLHDSVALELCIFPFTPFECLPWWKVALFTLGFYLLSLTFAQSTEDTCSLLSDTSLAAGRLHKFPVLPAAAFSFSRSSFFSCRRATRVVRIASLSFSRSCLSFRYLLASSSARVFPYLPYWLASEWRSQRGRAEVKCQRCRGCGKSTVGRRTAIFLPQTLSCDRHQN